MIEFSNLLQEQRALLEGSTRYVNLQCSDLAKRIGCYKDALFCAVANGDSYLIPIPNVVVEAGVSLYCVKTHECKVLGNISSRTGFPLAALRTGFPLADLC